MDIVHPDERDRVAKDFRRVEEQGETVYYEPMRIRHKDGRWVWIKAIATSYLSASGERCILEVSQDITEQVEAELPELVDDLRVHVVDATEIARAETGAAIPNTVMLGALLGLTHAAKLESIGAALTAKLEKRSEKLLRGNLAALEQAYKGIR